MFILFLLHLIFSLDANTFVYTVSLTDTPALIKLEIDFTAKQDKLVFDIKNKRIKRFKAFYTKNKKTYRLRYKKQAGKIIIPNSKNKNIIINYIVSINKTHKIDTESSFYYNNLFVLLSKDIFTIPDCSYDDTEQTKIFIKYKIPAAWKYFSSWTLHSGVSEIYTIKELLSGSIIIGNLSSRYVKINNKMYHFVFYNTQESDENSIIEKYTKIVIKQINLWGFVPHEKLFLFFFKSKLLTKVSEGIQFNNVIFYYLKNNVNLNNIDFLRLLAHEHFHLWNGSYIIPKKKAYNVTWFKEGFTEYYALLTLLQAGFININELLKEFSKRAMAYEKGNKKGDLILSLALDLETIISSKGISNSDNFIKLIETKSKLSTEGYDNNILQLSFISLSNWDVNDFFDKFILNNNLLNISNIISKIGLNIDVKKICKKQESYKTKKYRKYTKVISINKETNAYLSGLKKNDIILEKSLNEEGLIRLTILRYKKKRTIVFNPNICEKEIIWQTINKNKFFDAWLINRHWR